MFFDKDSDNRIEIGKNSFNWNEITDKPSTYPPSSHTHSYLPLSGGTMTGDITFAAIATWPTVSGETYPIQSRKISWSGSSDNASIFYEVTASDLGVLVFNVGDDANAYISFRNCGNQIGYINTNGIYGAVWNDYAEFRNQEELIEPGYCVYCDDNGKLKRTKDRLSVFEGIVSDTFGFAIGKTDECKTPLAVSGRVLVYVEGNREDYHNGDCLCTSGGASHLR